MKYLTYLIFGIFLISCTDKSNKNRIYFGGEIINPKSDVVLLMQNKEIIDSLPLGADNHFGTYVDNISPGLYYFQHGYEFQYLYLEPKDSLLIRLNTWDFDESLVFSGKGADRNELLIELFLSNERETDNFYTYFALPEEQFQIKINKTLAHHRKLLADLKESNKSLSDEYLHLAWGVIEYPVFRLKELYPYYHKKLMHLDTCVVSEPFYDFRKNIDINDTLLSKYHAHQNYVSAYLYNLAYQKNGAKGFGNDFRTILLQLITEKIKLPELKNRLLYREIYRMLFNDSYPIDSKHLSIFYENSTDSVTVKMVKQALKDKKKLPKNSHFIDFEVISPKGEVYSINRVLQNKNTAIYFYSPNVVSNEYLRKRVEYLTKKFPRLNFVGIDTRDPQNQEVLFHDSNNNQYYLKPNSKGRDLVLSKYPRVILIDSKGKVVNSFTLLTCKTIEKQLKKLDSLYYLN